MNRFAQRIEARFSALSRSFWTPINRRVKWSALSKLGNATIVRLTIVAPIFGYLILFNAELKPYLDITIPGETIADTAASRLHNQRDLFLYFGLVTLGLAAALYSMFAPEIIADHRQAGDFISFMENIKSPNLVRQYLHDVTSAFFAHNDGEQRSPLYSRLSYSCPEEVTDGLHALVRDSFTSAMQESGDEELISRFYTGSGYIQTDQVMEAMYSGRRVDQVFWEPVVQEAVNRSKEVFFLAHRLADFANFPIRVVIALLYSIGFLLLLVPTATTSLLIFQTRL